MATANGNGAVTELAFDETHDLGGDDDPGDGLTIDLVEAPAEPVAANGDGGEAVDTVEADIDQWRRRAIVWRERALASEALATALQDNVDDLRGIVEDLRLVARPVLTAAPEVLPAEPAHAAVEAAAPPADAGKFDAPLPEPDELPTFGSLPRSSDPLPLFQPVSSPELDPLPSFAPLPPADASPAFDAVAPERDAPVWFDPAAPIDGLPVAREAPRFNQLPVEGDGTPSTASATAAAPWPEPAPKMGAGLSEAVYTLIVPEAPAASPAEPVAPVAPTMLAASVAQPGATPVTPRPGAAKRNEPKVLTMKTKRRLFRRRNQAAAKKKKS